MLGYQGQITVDGAPFDGVGEFKFALVSPDLERARPAVVTAQVTNGFITGYTVVDGGANYRGVPEIVIADATGSGAVATATLSGGAVLTVQADASGSNYSANPIVTVEPPATIVDSLWSNDETSLDGSEPSAPVVLAIENGVFQVMLGDETLAHMTAVPAEAFRATDVRLRIWFNDGVQGFARLFPDQAMGSVGFAYRAEELSNPTFIGTHSETPLALSVNNEPVLRISAPTGAGRPVNILLGSSLNTVSEGVRGGTIAGGGGFFVTSTGDPLINQVNGDYSTISGGAGNTANGAGATIGGGFNNETAVGNATISGGSSNYAMGQLSTVGGGDYNYAEGPWSTISGGTTNRATYEGREGSIGGGHGNQVEGFCGTVPGGFYNTAAGWGSFAAGNQAKANGKGSFVWGDSQVYDVVAHNNNEFVARATGGFFFLTAIDVDDGSPTAGAKLLAGSGSWASWSDRASKENIVQLDPGEILAKVVALPVTEWNWKSQDASMRRIGPMAQDFHAAFGLGGEEDRVITASDADGVALAAIQGLNQKLEATVAQQEAEIQSLQAELAAIRFLLEAQATSPSTRENP